jgi:hypothetical protein
MDQTQLTKLIVPALMARQDVLPPPVPVASSTEQIVKSILNAPVNAQPPAPAVPKPLAPPLSPIDNILGGQLLAGKKTPLAIVAFVILTLLQPQVAAGTAIGAPLVLQILIMAFGALGLLGKFDRAILALGQVAATRIRAPATQADAAEVLRKLLEAITRTPATQVDAAEVLRKRLEAMARDGAISPKQVEPPPQFTGRTQTLSGKMSFFGGPDDHGVSPSEGLAIMDFSHLNQFREYFLPQQPPGTTGLARRLNPDAAYIACRWNYDVTPRAYLRSIKVEVKNPRTGQKEFAQPVDWGPNSRTGRVADLSPGLVRRLGLSTDQQCVVVVPLPS